MRIALTGSHGLIGGALADHLAARGDEVVRLVRTAAGAGEVTWDPAAGRLDGADLAGVDAVVHLAGAGIGDKRWSEARKRIVTASRVDSTALLARTLASLDPPPPVLLSGSAVGYYGDRGDETLREESGAGSGFLADLCREWEAATAPAEEAGIRVVRLRTGIVLARNGGALGKQLPLFRLGVGGRLGSGRQYWSWIALADEVAAITFAIDNDSVRGPVNLTAPNPATNREVTAALGRALHRPALLPVPRFALRTAMGSQMADEMLLSGQRAVPAVLEAAGFTFAHPDLDGALRAVLGPSFGPAGQG